MPKKEAKQHAFAKIVRVSSLIFHAECFKKDLKILKYYIMLRRNGN